jgi:hypothetical protein
VPLVEYEFCVCHLVGQREAAVELSKGLKIYPVPRFVGPLLSELNIMPKMISIDMEPQTGFLLTHNSNAIYRYGYLRFWCMRRVFH